MPTKRNYGKEYDNYQGKKKVKKYRAKVNRDRREALRKGKTRLGDGLDVAHIKNNPDGKYKMQNQSSNRSFPRNKRAGRKS